LGELLHGYDKIIVPELNHGQLMRILRAEYLVPAEPLGKIAGLPFRVAEVEQAIREALQS
jgi:2-oxoglutarate ferredoxin oxidoreductase subunit alpha